MKLCFFGGSFDPVHQGHLKMAENARNQMGFDKVLFCPVKCSPHKKNTMFSFRERLDLIDAAIRDKGFECWAEACPIEMHNDSNYSSDLIPAIRKHYHVEGKIYWLLGADQFKNLRTWHNYDYLNDNLHFCVYNRGMNLIDLEQVKFGTIIDGEDCIISSSIIRDEIERNSGVPYHLSLPCYEKFIHNLEMNETIRWFKERGITISTAESCTAGGIGSLIADGKGASDVLKCGYITYSTESKTALLGVNPDIIKNDGVVSSNVAIEMAKGCRKLAGTTVAISITGCVEPLDAYIGISTEYGDISFHVNEKTTSEVGIHSRNVNRNILAKYALRCAIAQLI